MRTLLIICAICVICGQINAAEYIITYKGQIPFWAPADIEAYSYDDWQSLTPELKSYNPPQYPTVVLRNTRIMSIQPGSWTNALADITTQQQTARDANLTPAQITDRNTCLANLASLLADFGIPVPIQPATAMSQMFAYWSAHPEDTTLTAKAQQVQFLYTRLRIEYGMTDPQIGGLE
ncbi:hypothetical protein EOL73_00105 [Candidatus Saccharibacteria bacterium]|nr:hypothetical protein [Candidatus Saccharibacteria bacterium]